MRRGFSRVVIAALALLLCVSGGGSVSACQTDADCGCGGDVRCAEGAAGSAGTFVPHLHFEVRRYDPADGPEAVSAKVDDRAKIALKGRGALLVLPPLPLPVPLRVQLSAGGGVCFEARYDAGGVVRNDIQRFDARGE